MNYGFKKSKFENPGWEYLTKKARAHYSLGRILMLESSLSEKERLKKRRIYLRNQLVEGSMNSFIDIARKILGKGARIKNRYGKKTYIKYEPKYSSFSLDDIVDDGVRGIIERLDNNCYRPKENFQTFLYEHIPGIMRKEAIKREELIHIPTNIWEDFFNTYKKQLNEVDKEYSQTKKIECSNLKELELKRLEKERGNLLYTYLFENNFSENQVRSICFSFNGDYIPLNSLWDTSEGKSGRVSDDWILSTDAFADEERRINEMDCKVITNSFFNWLDSQALEEEREGNVRRSEITRNMSRMIYAHYIEDKGFNKVGEEIGCSPQNVFRTLKSRFPLYAGRFKMSYKN
ncbi:MAG: hypothetical protein OQK82_06700 [Candidatus Pacearchaeota archaeon]|nr:hypothetical protein [Candidatus Pacearchaeota archaeon]